MAAKVKTVYACCECGAETARWSGQCPSCGAWNTLSEEVRQKTTAASRPAVTVTPKKLADIDEKSETRMLTGMPELDRVLGGGIVPGGLMLIGGDPGIGKSTLLLQVCASVGKAHTILYVSGEESARQIRLRADRLGVNTERLFVLCENDIDTMLAAVESVRPDLLVVGSIQTMTLSAVASSAGSVTQVRECTAAIMAACKAIDLPVFIVGHVNKDGAIAGPKVMEHIVDCVLSFEGERHTTYRLLRCAKNRYGSTNEIGVFEMGDKGLREVENPSQMLLSGRLDNVSGTCIACTMEGTRPLLAEVQGLVTPSAFGNARRMSTGFDYNRLNLILAVLEKRAGYFFSTLDVYVNIIGGLKLEEPAADLAVAMALVSGLKDTPLPHDALAFGEIGLSGEVRAVNAAQQRVNEAARLGFTRIILPMHNLDGLFSPDGVTLIGVKTVREAYEAIH